MIINILIVAVCLVIAAIFNSEMDTIKFAPERAWSKSEFWLRNLWQVGWFRKTFGFFTLDGWHLCKGGMIYSLLYPHAFLISGSVLFSILITIPLMMVLGAVFELSYNN